MASARVVTTWPWRWSFPMCQIRRNVTIEHYQLLVRLRISYKYVYGRNV
jgi:hypothetical protein